MNAFILLFSVTALAQQPTTVPSTDARATPSPEAGQAIQTRDERYRIGAGDVLDIRVFNRPQLSRDAVRVDGRGVIRMPFIEGEIRAACHTEGELATEIATKYLKYQRNPQVDVYVKEFQSQPVAVVGAVRAPGRFQLQRRVRLLELLTFAGGPTETAGRNIQIIHSVSTPSLCDELSAEVADDASTALVSYRLTDLLRGDEAANPYVRPGDFITLPVADQAYVVGNVMKPGPIPLKEPVTLTMAIGMAGGTLRDTKKERIRIQRQQAGSTTKSEILVDLKAIDTGHAPDIALQANDIVDVPTNTGFKRVLTDFSRALVPSLGSLPLRVIY